MPSELQLPAWARLLAQPDVQQVSHGLNLALPLRDPAVDLEALFTTIAVAQPVIRRALTELNFVHFARFVPSWDGRALMVITEFDGPLEAYVLDFAIAIGDVFTALLSRVHPDAHPPRLPVKDHPDEFMAFVRQWNRVPVTPRPEVGSPAALLPPDADFPVYSAYPDKTVVDITGPRSKLPAPVVDRPAAPIDLADVQANLLQSHNAKRAKHWLVEITDADAARRWLGELAQGAVGNVPAIASAAMQEEKPRLNVGFTYEGMRRLWPGREAELAGFPEAFRQGPAVRRRQTGDWVPADGEPKDGKPPGWLFGRTDQPPVHAMLSLHAFDEEDPFKKAVDAIERALKRNRLNMVHSREAAPPGNSVGFGFRDGLSAPRIAGQPSKADDLQPACSPGEFLLGERYVDIYGGKSIAALPVDLATNSTFCAVRLIEQHVDRFEKLLDAGAAQGHDREFVAARLMGRWRSGAPLTLYGTSNDHASALAVRNAHANGPSFDERNDFDYAPSHEYPNTADDHHGKVCPVGSHIRRANPRSARVAGSRHGRRLIRRGMSWRDDESGRQGLWGLFYCGSLERQYEFILREWINGDGAASGIRGTRDPIAGRGGPIRLAGMRRDGGDLVIDGIGPLTTTLGSVYLFVPGLKAIRAFVPRVAKAGHEKAAAPMPEGWKEAAARAVDAALSPAALLANEGLAAKPAVLPPQAQQPPAPAGFDPTDVRFIADPYPADGRANDDPYPTYALLRQRFPVCWVPRHQGFWVTRRASVEAMCRDGDTFLQRQPGADGAPRQVLGLLSMDGARHAQARRLMKEAIDPVVKGFEAQAGGLLDGVIEDLRDRRHFDLVGDFALRVWRDVWLPVMGIPEPARDAVDRLAHGVMRSNDRTLGELQQLAGKQGVLGLIGASAPPAPAGVLVPLLKQAYVEAVEAGALHKPAAYGGTLLQQIALRTDFTALPAPEGSLSILETGLTLLQFVLASMASEFLLATGARNLLLDHGQGRPWDALAEVANDERAFGTLLGKAVDECRRFDSPLQVIERYTAKQTTLDGVTLPAGAFVQGVIGSANRDDTGCDAQQQQRYGSLDRFSVEREGFSHLALGGGAHECLGKWLQSQLVPMALGRLVKAKPGLRLQSPKAVPPWIPNIYYRTFTALAVTDA